MFNVFIKNALVLHLTAYTRRCLRLVTNMDDYNTSVLPVNNSLPVKDSTIWSAWALTTTVAYSVLFLVSVIGNSLILLIIRRDNRLKTTHNILVANMAVSDILCILFSVPLAIYKTKFPLQWPIGGLFGKITVKMSFLIPDVTSAVSFYSCLFIAIDRYLAVAHPLKGGFSKSRLKYVIPGIWISSVILWSPYFYSVDIIEIGDTIYIGSTMTY